MIIEENSKLVMIGDSVSDCERARPCGEGLFESIGKSYIGLMDGLLKTIYPEKKIRIVNMGISGNNVRDLENRWETDVFALNPDWVSILIGANDVWRQFDTPLLTEQHVYMDEYEERLERLVSSTKPKVKGMILIAPYYMEPNKEDKMRKAMDGYGAIVKKIAEKYDAVFVDLQAAFDIALKEGHSSRFSWDRVHPNLSGHMLIAKTILDKIGFSWDGEGCI